MLNFKLSVSLYHLTCQHGEEGDEGAHLAQDGSLSLSSAIKPKSKIQQQIDKSRETILVEAFTKVVNLKNVKKISVSTELLAFKIKGWG